MKRTMLMTVLEKALQRRLACEQFGEKCDTCGKLLEPYDIGTDEYNQITWTVACCGKRRFWTSETFADPGRNL